MHASGEYTTLLNPRQEQPDWKPQFRALRIVAGVVIVLLLMFATYRLGKRSAPSAVAGDTAPGSATMPVTIPAGPVPTLVQPMAPNQQRIKLLGRHAVQHRGHDPGVRGAGLSMEPSR